MYTGKRENLERSDVTLEEIKQYVTNNRNIKKLLDNLVKTIDKKHYGKPAVKIIEKIHGELAKEDKYKFTITPKDDDFKNKVAQQLIIYGVDENKVKFKFKKTRSENGLKLLGARISKELREKSKEIKKRGESSNEKVTIEVKLPKTIDKTDSISAGGIMGLLPPKFRICNSSTVLKVPDSSSIQISDNAVKVTAEVNSEFIKSDHRQ